MVERIRPQPLLSHEDHRDFGRQWAEQERKFLRDSKHFPYTNYRLASEINQAHEVHFIERIIPEKIAQLRKQGNHRRVAVIDLGCGLGFFNDQLRKAFPQDIIVYGTTLMRRDAMEQRRALITEAHGLKTAGQDRRLKNIHTVREFADFSPTMHPNDGKWHSILELRRAPEFDIMIDTMGELHYAYDPKLPPELREQYFLRVLRACLVKLQEEGMLYVADLMEPEADIVHEHQKEIADHYGVTISAKTYGQIGERRYRFIKKGLSGGPERI